MARTSIIGFETNDTTVMSLDGQASGTAPANATITSLVKRTGTYSAKVAAASGSSSYFFLNSNWTNQWVRVYVMVTARPSTTARTILGDGGGVSGLSVKLNPSGTLSLYENSTLLGTSTTALTNTSQWYRIEVKAATAAELKIDGNLEASGTAGGSMSQDVGAADTLADTYTAYFDDIVVDNAAYPGPGAVVLLMPTSDAGNTAWTTGAGGTTSLFDAVNNLPPAGLATETATSNIKSGSSTGTANYSANLTSYTAAGVPTGSTINSLGLFVVHGEDIATGTKTGKIEGVSNPVIAAATFTFGQDSGAHGNYPGFWRTTMTFIQTPTVTLGTSPWIKVTKTDTTTRVACVCDMGIYVDYTPPAGTTYTQSLTAGLTFSGAFGTGKINGKSLAAALTFAGAFSKSDSKVHTAALTFSGAFKKTTSRAFTGGLSFSGALSNAKVTLKSLTGGLSFSGSFSRAMNKGLAWARVYTGLMAHVYQSDESGWIINPTTGNTIVSQDVTSINSGPNDPLQSPNRKGWHQTNTVGEGNSDAIMSPEFALPASADTFAVSAIVATDATSGWEPQIGLTFYDSAHASIGGGSNTVPLSTGWSRGSVVVAAKPANAVYGRVGARGTGVFNYYWHSVTVQATEHNSSVPFGNILGRTTNRAFTAALTFAGAFKKSSSRAFTGGLSFSGALSAVKTVLKALTGGLSFSGNLAKRDLKPLSGGLTFAGALSTLHPNLKSLTAGLTFSGSLSKSLAKTLADAKLWVNYAKVWGQSDGWTTNLPAGATFAVVSEPSGVFGTNRRPSDRLVLRETTGSTPGGNTPNVLSPLVSCRPSTDYNIIINAARDVDGNAVVVVNWYTSASVFISSSYASWFLAGGSDSAINVYSTSPANAAFMAVGISNDTVNSTLWAHSARVKYDDFVTPGPVLTKMASRPLTAALTFSGNLIKSGRKALTAALNFSGAITRVKVGLKSLTGGLSFSGAMAIRRGKGLTAGLTFSGLTNMRTSKFFTGGLSFAGALARSPRKALTASLAFVGNLTTVRRIARFLTASLAFVGALNIRRGKLFTAALTFSGNLLERFAFITVSMRLINRIISMARLDYRSTIVEKPRSITIVAKEQD